MTLIVTTEEPSEKHSFVRCVIVDGYGTA